MATDEGSEEDDFYERVLSVSRTRFVSDMDPVALLDAFLQTEFIDYDLYRDISEIGITSQKNRQIIEIVRGKGRWGYSCFKKCLKDSNQGHLVDHLEQNEKKIERTKTKKTFPKNERVSDADLAQISNAIGKNWELLAPILGLSNTEVDHLEMNYQTVQLRIYHMLMTWKIRTAEDATTANLISKILSIPSVNLNMAVINKYKRHASGPVLPATDMRVTPEQTSEYPQKPVEHEISSSSKTDRSGYQQMSSIVNDGVTVLYERTNDPQISLNRPSKTDENTYEQTRWNVIDGVTSVKERTKEHPGIDNHQNASGTNILKAGEDQVDTVVIPGTGETFKALETSSGTITTENGPIQASGDIDDKIDNVISQLESIKEGAKSKTSLDKNQPKIMNSRLSKYIKAEPSEASNDKSTGGDNRKMLKEQFRPQRDKPERKCTHDGRLMIYGEEVFTAIKNYCNTDKPKIGGFGSVYLSEKKIPGLEIKVALKEIKCTTGQRHMENSTINEKLASRTMHFAIVPLLFMGCDKDRKTYWFLSPCLDKGDLNTLIEKDTKRIEGNLTKDIELNRQRRVKIVYHICAAIDFLHTEIKMFRGAVIHLDVKSENVVLDRYYNARLTDFGVAREVAGGKTSVRKTSHTAIPLTQGYFKPPTFEKLEKYFDYYNIGIVIRELLTGKSPCFKEDIEDLEEQYLKDIDQDTIKSFYIQDEIWQNQETEQLCCEAEKLLEISKRCIESASTTEKITSGYILNEIQSIATETWKPSPSKRDNSELASDKEDNSKCKPATTEDNSKRLPVIEENSENFVNIKENSEPGREEDNCDLCMVNPPVEKGLLSHERKCPCPLNVCVSCMRNSYLNPLHCHSCFKEIDPIIGSGWGAVLVAGRYDDDITFSNSCAKDVADIERLVVSKCPLVIGIRKMFVKTILLNNRELSQAGIDVTSQIQSAFNELKERGVRTLFVYYSGYYLKDHGLVLQRSENTDVASTEKQFTIEYLSVQKLRDMLRVFRENSSNKIDKDVILILDCCGANTFGCIESDEDHCIRIAQLNAFRPNQEPEGIGSFFKKMFIQGLTMKARGDKCFLQKSREPCHICPIKGGDFITIGELTSYISRHAEAYHDHQDHHDNQDTNTSIQVNNFNGHVKIGYSVDTSADLIFTFVFRGMQKDCTIPCHFFNEINQLKRAVFKEFMEKMKMDKEQGKTLELNADFYHDILRIITKAGPKDTHKQELTSLEQVLSAWNGKRELFAEMREISLINEGMVGVFTESKNMKIFSLLDDWKYSMEDLGDRTIYKIDVSTYLVHYKKCVRELSVGVSKCEKQSTELHFITPSMTDETGVRLRRDDFICLKLEKKTKQKQPQKGI